jgi:hypothetical protein
MIVLEFPVVLNGTRNNRNLNINLFLLNIFIILIVVFSKTMPKYVYSYTCYN